MPRACVEEDKTCRESWKQTRNIVDYAMYCQHQTVLTNAWQRHLVFLVKGTKTLSSTETNNTHCTLQGYDSEVYEYNHIF
jgi:hypothetical protein